MSQSKAEQSAIAQLFAPESMGTIKVLDTPKREHIASMPDGDLVTNLAIQLFEIERLEAELSKHRKIRDELKAELKSRQPKGKRGRPSNSDRWPELVQKFIQLYAEQKAMNPELAAKDLATSLISPYAKNETVLNAWVKTFTNNISEHGRDL